MCGIAGKLIFNREITETDIKNVKANRDAVAHRGPDGYGLTVKKNMILAHRRLSVIDLSDQARQPMSSIDGRYHISFNGEIYNFKELKEVLIKRGYTFFSQSDTEVVLNAYREYGSACLNKFNGMFGFAIWDNLEETLFLARDRFGQKPLFYYKNQDAFTFSSELKGLRADKSILLKTSNEALNCFLALGYILNPLTMYEDVLVLEPATYMKINKDGKILCKHEYWDYAESFRNRHTEKEAEITHNITELLRKAVKRRMISDVPVGAFLSGGIDSSAIVSIMKELHTGELHTFSVGFKQNSYNELEDAYKVSRLLNTIHHDLIVDKTGQMDAFLQEIMKASDQVFADNSIIPMLEVSKLASKEITVALSGDGADEIFAGYITYTADSYYNKAKMMPLFLRQIFSHENINFLPFSKQKINFDYKRKQFFKGTFGDYQEAHYSWRQIFNEEERVAILGEQHRELIYDTNPLKKFRHYYKKVADLPKLDQHLFVDAKTWLTDDILYKVDRSTMFASIEARTPFLDIDLVNYAAGIHPDIKFKNGNKKAVLKKALKGLIPNDIIKKKKSGFNAPVYQWLNSSENNEFKGYTRYIFENMTKEF